MLKDAAAFGQRQQDEAGEEESGGGFRDHGCEDGSAIGGKVGVEGGIAESGGGPGLGGVGGVLVNVEIEAGEFPIAAVESESGTAGVAHGERGLRGTEVISRAFIVEAREEEIGVVGPDEEIGVGDGWTDPAGEDGRFVGAPVEEGGAAPFVIVGVGPGDLGDVTVKRIVGRSLQAAAATEVQEVGTDRGRGGGEENVGQRRKGCVPEIAADAVEPEIRRADGDDIPNGVGCARDDDDATTHPHGAHMRCGQDPAEVVIASEVDSAGVAHLDLISPEVKRRQAVAGNEAIEGGLGGVASPGSIGPGDDEGLQRGEAQGQKKQGGTHKVRGDG